MDANQSKLDPAPDSSGGAVGPIDERLAEILAAQEQYKRSLDNLEQSLREFENELAIGEQYVRDRSPDPDHRQSSRPIDQSIAGTQTAKSTPGSSRKTTGANPCSEALKISGAGLLLALGVHTFVAESRYIPSRSMEPTLQVEDCLLIDKVTYHFEPLSRGDVVVFKPPPALLGQGISGGIIKRVIGLPGERVQVKGGQVFINQHPLQESYIASKPNYSWGPQVVPLGSYLVLGDNRNQSYDGHYWGFVPHDRIVGRAVVRYWPLSRAGVLP